MKGYAGKILHVDLTAQKTSIEEPSEDTYRRYLGGGGFVAYYLLREIPKGADPLGPENVLVFTVGPFTGITLAGAGRNSMGAKSPLGGGYGEADVGGFFGAELKRAGFDGIVVKGIAKKPVYLWIEKGEVEIRSAEHLWGKETLDCLESLKEELGEKNLRMAAIGPAGEKLVRFACVMNDTIHAAGRTGLGAVMGSKNLKCVIAKGEGRVEVEDSDKVNENAKYMRDNWRDHSEGMHDLGTAGGIPGLQELGALPTRNFQDGQFEGFDKISGQAMKDTILIDRDSCFACPVRCKRVVEVSDDEYQVDKNYGGPEYETIGAFGSNCGIDDLRAVAKANEICNAVGMDTITAGMAVSFAMECYENGLITKEDTGGLDLSFGNCETMVELTRQMGAREGFGDLLADGFDAAIKKIGPKAADYAITVKGQPFPMHECRVRHGQGLGYAVSPTGADHMHNFWDNSMSTDPVSEAMKSQGIYKAMPMNELNGRKVQAYINSSNWSWLGNNLGVCAFIGWSKNQVVSLLEGITGWETTIFELMKTGARTVTMARVFNMREGVTRTDDLLPKRIMTESHKSGTVNEKPITREELEESLTTFYTLMGWDPETGKPLDATLEALEIEWLKGVIA